MQLKIEQFQKWDEKEPPKWSHSWPFFKTFWPFLIFLGNIFTFYSDVRFVSLPNNKSMLWPNLYFWEWWMEIWSGSGNIPDYYRVAAKKTFSEKKKILFWLLLTRKSSILNTNGPNKEDHRSQGQKFPFN